MKLNMEKMRAKLEASTTNKKAGSGNENTWKPDAGNTDIRIVPTKDGDPFKEFSFHYNLGEGNQGILCPKRNFNENCPICAFASSQWQEGTDESKTQAKKMFPQQRFFSPVLVRGKEEMGVKIWGYGKKAYEKLLSLVLNPEYGDITDVDEGLDLTLTYTKPTKKGAYPTTDLNPKRKNSPLAKTKGEIKTLLDNVPDINSLFLKVSTVEVKEMLDAFLDSPEDSRKDESEKYGNSSDEVKNLDAAIEEMSSELDKEVEKHF